MSSGMDAAGLCCCLRFADKFKASGAGIGMHPFGTSSSCGDGETGEMPGGCPNTCASFRVVRIRPARSLAVRALDAEKAGREGSRSAAEWGSGLGFLDWTGELLFADRER